MVEKSHGNTVRRYRVYVKRLAYPRKNDTMNTEKNYDGFALKFFSRHKLSWHYSYQTEFCWKDTRMDYVKGKITKLMVDYFGNDFRRITHALEVMKHAERIMENTEVCDFEVMIASALLHDIGIKQSEEIHGYNSGKTQEQYGPPVAERLLKSIDLDEMKIRKICEIIGNHHSPSRYEYVELMILKEADMIVNRLEGDGN
jgi:predicted HD phosphohydrolase